MDKIKNSQIQCIDVIHFTHKDDTPLFNTPLEVIDKVSTMPAKKKHLIAHQIGNANNG